MIPNVLLFSPGLGYINRGLETFTRELYMNLKFQDNLGIKLYQANCNVLEGAESFNVLKRNSSLYKYWPFSKFQNKSYRIECLMFSLPIIYYCYTNPNIILHFSEQLPANVLYHLRKRFGGSFKLLFSNGGPLTPEHYMKYEYLHALTPTQKKQALDAGYPAENIYLIPYGLDCKKFKKNTNNIKKLKQKWKIPNDKTIILSVGAVNSRHKRMDWLIKEFSSFDPKRYFLLIAGQIEEESREIISLSKKLLQPNSYSFISVPYEQIPEIYHCADCFVLCSLNEGFGRVYIEAMASGLPVIAHKNLNTEWILGKNNPGLLDLTIKNKILNFINGYVQNSNKKELITMNIDKANKSFDWNNLIEDYLNMYSSIYN